MKLFNNLKSQILIICGPTSSGKTALALRLAGTRPTSIISADSRQIYRGLTILTGKDIPPDSAVRFYGFDLCEPNETFSAAECSDRMRSVIENETKENRQIIVVGGTGFYLSAITQPASLAKVPPDEKLRQKLNRFSVAELQRKLKEVGPKRLASMNQSDVNNPRRLIRAIEVASSPTGSNPVSVIPTEVEESLSFAWVGLRLPLGEIKENIINRVDRRLDAAIAEVKALLSAYPNRSLPIYTSLGVKPILRYLAGEVTEQQLRELWITDEVNYAKRQLTWFKKQKQIIWYDKNKASQIKLDQLL